MAEITTIAGPKDQEFCINFLKENGISREIAKLVITAPTLDGDHFSSRCEFWTVHCKDEGPPLEFFVKKSVTNESYASVLREMQMFVKETGFFKSFLPDLINFVEHHGGYDGYFENVFPKCYHADKDIIVLENVAKQGYFTMDKLTSHNLEQTRQVLQIMAKLHGMSYAFIESMGTEKCLKAYPYLQEATLWSQSGLVLNGSFIFGAFEGALKVLETCPSPGSPKVLEFVRQYQLDGFWKIAEIYDLESKSCAHVLNHGDCWGPNVMFNGNSSTQETADQCLLIDFQTVHLGSPVLDVMYYLYFTTDAEVRRKEWKALLHEYYDSLKSSVEKTGFSIKFSFEDLMKDYRSKAVLGFFLSMFPIFAMEGLGEMKDVEKVQGNMAEYFKATIIATVDRNLSVKGPQYSQGLVKAFKEYESLKHGQDDD